jgi:hypothetical protein
LKIAYSIYRSYYLDDDSVNIDAETYDKSYNYPQNYGYYWNSIWLVAATMTQIGYGDFYPRTHFGRAILSVSAIYGIFILSILIIAIGNMSKFDQPQRNVIFK